MYNDIIEQSDVQKLRSSAITLTTSLRGSQPNHCGRNIVRAIMIQSKFFTIDTNNHVGQAIGNILQNRRPQHQRCQPCIFHPVNLLGFIIIYGLLTVLTGWIPGSSSYRPNALILRFTGRTQYKANCLHHCPSLNLPPMTRRPTRLFSVFNSTIDLQEEQLAPAHSNHVTAPSSPSASETTTPSSPILPRHVAFICDGNARWATARGLPAAAGHKKGADRCLKLIEALQSNYTTVEYCTFFGFSTENWKRPPKEIYEILKVLEQTAHQLLSENLNHRRQQFINTMSTLSSTSISASTAVMPRPVQLKILGDLTDERLPWGLKQVLSRLEQETQRSAAAASLSSSHHSSSPPLLPLTVCLALNYGGRRDILQASIQLAEALASGQLQAKDVTEEIFASMLTTSDIPDPDLMIRTSGESRISNFLLWNAAYAELYFTQTLWPDFGTDELNKAMSWYSQRCRRFGARSVPQPTFATILTPLPTTNDS